MYGTVLYGNEGWLDTQCLHAVLEFDHLGHPLAGLFVCCIGAPSVDIASTAGLHQFLQLISALALIVLGLMGRPFWAALRLAWRRKSSLGMGCPAFNGIQREPPSSFLFSSSPLPVVPSVAFTAL